MLNFHAVQGVVLDMDGVIWRGAEILPGIPDFFQFLDERHTPYLFATNNSTKNVQEYVARLQTLGIEANPSQILSSSVVTLNYLQQHIPIGTPAYIIGSESLNRMVSEAGYPIDPDTAEVVIVGLDVNITYEKFKIAGRRVLAGATFIGTNIDRTFPVLDGLNPGAGTMIAVVQTMTEVAPIVMGKPQAAMFALAQARLGTDAEHTLMIGDRLDTDIYGAKLAGWQAALVLTGVTSERDHSDRPPDGVYTNLPALWEAWRSA